MSTVRLHGLTGKQIEYDIGGWLVRRAHVRLGRAVPLLLFAFYRAVTIYLQHTPFLWPSLSIDTTGRSAAKKCLAVLSSSAPIGCISICACCDCKLVLHFNYIITTIGGQQSKLLTEHLAHTMAQHRRRVSFLLVAHYVIIFI